MKKESRIAIALGLVLCLILLCVFSARLTRRFGLRADMTADSLYAISGEAETALSGMKDPVQITVLNTEPETPLLIREILSRMGQASKEKLKLAYLDPYTHPAAVAKWQNEGLTLAPGTLIVEGKTKSRAVQMEELFDTDEAGNLTLLRLEQKLIPAILSASSPEDIRVQFVNGHDEAEPEGLKHVFENSGYACSRLPLSVSTPNADLVVIAAPATDYELAEIEKLSAYLLNGGGLLVFLDSNSSQLPHFSAFLAEWGIGVTDSLIAEHRQYVDGNPLSIVPVYARHEINEVFSSVRIYPVLSQTVSLEPLFLKNGGIATAKVLYSSDRAYVYSGTAEKAPYVLAMTSTLEQSSSRVFVCGSAGVCAESFVDAASYANARFLSEAAAWCLGNQEEEPIALPARSVDHPTIAVTAGEQRLMGIVLCGVLPGIILILGCVIVIRRRRL